MAKTTLGYFKEGDQKYNLFYRLGYGDKTDFVYVGSHSKGNLFRFHKDEEKYIYLMISWNANDHFGYTVKATRLKRLYIPKSKDDLRKILNMILKGMGCELISLNIESRERLVQELFKYLVVKRLEGK